MTGINDPLDTYTAHHNLNFYHYSLHVRLRVSVLYVLTFDN